MFSQQFQNNLVMFSISFPHKGDKVLTSIEAEITRAGGFPLIVGGYVRDAVLGLAPKDIDIEVYGLDVDVLIDILSRYGAVDVVGRSFGVVKLTTPEGLDFDFSLPRRDSKNGVGHKGFEVKVDPGLSVKEAASRRDFTFNAMAMTFGGDVIDYYDGLIDLEIEFITATSPAFKEDPLRVLRGMQFAGRFGFINFDELTLDYANEVYDEYSSLAKERVWGEWWKWATKSVKPSAGLRFLRETGWIDHYPELRMLPYTPQDPEWHPEGDVWQHTLHVCDAMAEQTEGVGWEAHDRGVLMLAALCHDMGKADATVRKNGRWVSPGHNKPEAAVDFLKSIGAPKDVIAHVKVLVQEHMIHLNPVTEKGARRLLNRLGDTKLEWLEMVIEADHSGRPPLFGGMPEQAQEWWNVCHNEIALNGRPEPIVKGRHFLQMGFEPGKLIGELCREAFEIQLDTGSSSIWEIISRIEMTFIEPDGTVRYPLDPEEVLLAVDDAHGGGEYFH